MTGNSRVIAPTGGSQQLRIFRRAVRDGATLDQACEATGNVIDAPEGRLILAADAKNPPPPEAYELIGQPKKETAMAAAAKKENGEGAGISGEYKRPDAKQAIKIYREHIDPKNEAIAKIKGDMSDPFSRIKDDCHFPKAVLVLLFRLHDMEDAKRDHHLLALSEGMKELKLEVPRDLVSMAQGEAGGSVVPIGDRRRPQLATLPMGIPSDGSETDLADAAEDDDADDDDFEASEEELAGQQGRPGNDADEEEPAHGTGAAAAKGMGRRKKATAAE